MSERAELLLARARAEIKKFWIERFGWLHWMFLSNDEAENYARFWCIGYNQAEKDAIEMLGNGQMETSFLDISRHARELGDCFQRLCDQLKIDPIKARKRR